MTSPRTNPFRSECLERLEYRGADWTEVENRLAKLRVSVVLGKHGSGKTTFLRSLARRLEAASRPVRIIFLNSDKSSHAAALCNLSPLDEREVVIIDGAEQLSAVAKACLRWRLRRASRIIFTAHTKSPLPILWQCAPTAEVFSELLVSLTETAPGGDAIAVFDQTEGNMREAFRRLYDLEARR